MRLLSLLLLLLALAVPTLALAGRSAPGDGSLVVADASGVVTVQGSGPIFGHFDRGSMTVLDYRPDGNLALSVSGARMKPTASNDPMYVGNDVRFLLPGGKYTLRFEGVGIDISAVGKGKLETSGRGSGNDGSFSVNGAKAQSVTPSLTKASFGGVPSATAEKGTAATGRSS